MKTLEDYLSLVAPEHRDSPKFMAELTALLQPLVDMQNFFLVLKNAFDLDNAIGVQLDQVGQWVGRTRNIDTPLQNVYFSFDEPGLGYDQGNWKGPFDPANGLSVLDDDSYRLLLRAKIAANAWDGTVDGANNVLNIVFGPLGTKFFLVDHQDMSMTIAVAGTVPSTVFVALLFGGYIPLKPEGVRVDYEITSVDTRPIFGFDVENDYISGFDVGAWALKEVNGQIPIVEPPITYLLGFNFVLGTSLMGDGM